MLKSKKHVFWEALLITVVIFILGLLIGISIEKNRLETIEDYYSQSEVSLLDLLGLQKFVELDKFECETLIQENKNFADKIYEEAKILEDYESSNQLTESLKISHQKYDILRAFVWLNLLDLDSRCSNDFDTIVYLYEFEVEDVEQDAKQKVWSNILYDLKLNQSEDLILIPIAVDMNLYSVNVLLSEFEIERFPAVIINNDDIVYEISSVDELIQKLD